MRMSVGNVSILEESLGSELGNLFNNRRHADHQKQESWQIYLMGQKGLGPSEIEAKALVAASVVITSSQTSDGSLPLSLAVSSPVQLRFLVVRANALWTDEAMDGQILLKRC